jgi:hypothetical protein
MNWRGLQMMHHLLPRASLTLARSATPHLSQIMSFGKSGHGGSGKVFLLPPSMRFQTRCRAHTKDSQDQILVLTSRLKSLQISKLPSLRSEAVNKLAREEDCLSFSDCQTFASRQ